MDAIDCLIAQALRNALTLSSSMRKLRADYHGSHRDGRGLAGPHCASRASKAAIVGETWLWEIVERPCHGLIFFYARRGQNAADAIKVFCLCFARLRAECTALSAWLNSYSFPRVRSYTADREHFGSSTVIGGLGPSLDFRRD